jgi:hypothetical protein
MSECDTSQMIQQRGRQQFEQARMRGWLGQAWATLMGNPHHLAELKTVAGEKLTGGRYVGVKTILVRAIHGSEGRSRDFDTNFNPLTNHTQARWLSIFTAQECGAALPPVELIRVGETYFVRDGHHRLSVARAIGQEYVEARVMVWE